MEYTLEQLKMIFDCIPGIAVMNVLRNGEHHNLFFKDSVPGFFGVSKEEIINEYKQDASLIMLEEDRKVLNSYAVGIINTNHEISLSCRCKHAILGFIWVQVIFRYLGTYQGDPIYLSVFHGEGKDLATNAPGGIIVYSGEGDDQLYYISPNMLRMLGYCETEFRTKVKNHFSLIIYQKDRKQVISDIDQQVAKDNYVNIDYRIEKKDKTLMWVHNEGHCVVDETGRKTCYVSINDVTETIREKERLTLQTSEMERIIANIPSGIMVYKVKKSKIEFVAANNTVFNELGLSREQLVNGVQKDFVKIIHPDDLKNTVSIMSKFGTPNAHFSFITRLRSNKEANYKWLRFETKTVNAKDEVFAYSIISDVTIEKENEQALEKKRQYELERFNHEYQLLVMSKTNSLCMFVLNLSKNTCDLLNGKSQGWVDLIADKSVDGLLNNVIKYIDNEDAQHAFSKVMSCKSLLTLYEEGQRMQEMVYRRSDEKGNLIWVRLVVSMLEEPISHDVVAAMYSEDIDTQIKDREIIQRVTDREFDYIALINVKTHKYQSRYIGNVLKNYQEFNGEKLNVTWDYETVVERAILNWIDEDKREEMRQKLQLNYVIKQLKDDEVFKLVLSGNSPTGENWKQLRFSWLDDTNNWIMVEQMDITEMIIKQREELMERLNTEQELRQVAVTANKMKSDFLSNVSHDMRTPLNAVLGYDRLALETDDIELKDRYLKKIRSAGETLHSLIDDTLDLQKIESGKMVLKKSISECTSIIAGVVDSVKPMMDAKGINFELVKCQQVETYVNVDYMRIEEILINLLSNAIKFTKPEGNIKMQINCEDLDKQYIETRIVISDDGIGISDGFLPKVFEPFAQERGVDNFDTGGSGLGLSIVKKLVDLMGGTISVDSELNKGTVFTVKLKLERAEPVEHREESVDVSAINLNGKRVLLCEDNDMNREIVHMILAKWGVLVDETSNGALAIQKYAEAEPNTYDAILMDIRMPIVDGYQATAAIRNSKHADAGKIPIIAMSADAYSEDIRRCLDSGMNAHLAKPINQEILYKELGKWLNKQS